jgi:hypothetical protein
MTHDEVLLAMIPVSRECPYHSLSPAVLHFQFVQRDSTSDRQQQAKVCLKDMWCVTLCCKMPITAKHAAEHRIRFQDCQPKTKHAASAVADRIALL